MDNKLRLIIIFTLSTLLIGCGSVTKTNSRYAQEHDSAPGEPKDVKDVPDAVPKHEPKSKYGNMDSYEVFGKRYYTKDSSSGYVAQGKASWYGTKFHGARTSSGETYDMYEMTAAHTTLPLPTYARVTNTANGKSVIVKINDRGPFHSDRIIDLSYAAAARIGILNQGVGHVKVEAIDPNTHKSAPIPTIMSAENKKAPAPASDQYYLQVAAFGDKTYAEKMMRDLENIIDEPMQISQKNSSDFYRVQVGPFKDETSAKAYESQLASLIAQKPVLVTR
ncbi:MAG: septal ring lytic transglycosylase RlpA family protein [Legionellales bacterium]|jgi:rare lipoprotein A